MYFNKFFPNLIEAKKFQKKNGGAIYVKPVKRTRSKYHCEAYMAGMTQEEMKHLPYCVAWNGQSR